MVAAIVGAIPSLASAQSLAGAVRDTSGAVLPGVTIEASSPALITKVRTGVTDETGQYRIPDLPPGTYKVTFTLPGFATVVREGVELSGGGVMLPASELLAVVDAAGFRVTATDHWLQHRQFKEWAAIVANARSLHSLEVAMRAFADAGITAGIGLRPSADSVEFEHHWAFVTAQPFN